MVKSYGEYLRNNAVFWVGISFLLACILILGLIRNNKGFIAGVGFGMVGIICTSIGLGIAGVQRKNDLKKENQ